LLVYVKNVHHFHVVHCLYKQQANNITTSLSLVQMFGDKLLCNIFYINWLKWSKCEVTLIKSKALQIAKNKIKTDTFRNITPGGGGILRNTQTTTVHPT